MNFEQVEQLKKQGRFAEALASVEAALLAAPEELELLLEKGHCARLIGDFAIAEEAYAAAWTVAEQEHDGYAALDAMLGLISTQRARGQYQQALALLEEAKELVAELKDEQSLPHLHWVEGTVLRYAGQLDAAESSLGKGLEWARQLQDCHGEGYILAALGGLCRVRGKDLLSQQYYRDAYEVFNSLDDAFGLAYTACGRGNAARMLEQWEEAKRFFAEAAERYKVFGDRVSYAYTLWAWGTLHKMLGQLDQAREKFLAADAFFIETGDRRGRTHVQLGLWELDILQQGGAATNIADIQKAAFDWRQVGLPLEAAFADLLVACATDNDTRPANLELRRLGTVWQASALPLNIP